MRERIRSGKVRVGEGRLRDKQQRFIGFVYKALFTVKSLSNQTRAGPLRAAGSRQECVGSVEECSAQIKCTRDRQEPGGCR